MRKVEQRNRGGRFAKWKLIFLLPLGISSAEALAGRIVPIAETGVREAIHTYLEKSGWAREAQESFAMRWPRAVAKSTAQVRVISAQRDSPSSLKLILACQPRSACLDFWVAVEFGGPSLAPESATRHSPSLPAESGFLIRAGQAAQLTITEPGMRLQLAVMCLENGRLRQKVRVLDAASHRVFSAEVAGKNELQARWQ